MNRTLLYPLHPSVTPNINIKARLKLCYLNVRATIKRCIFMQFPHMQFLYLFCNDKNMVIIILSNSNQPKSEVRYHSQVARL